MKRNRFNRVFVIVLDSLGIGAMNDASKYDDVGSNTFGHIAEHFDKIKIPNLERMGWGLLGNFKNVEQVKNPIGYIGKLNERSNGKDTMTGHWELMGLLTSKPFKTFTDTGFPKELMDELEKRTGCKFIGNSAASGTQILEDLGERHMKTGEVIIYTSADSVMQLAAHEETFGLKRLYEICEIAREITLKEEWMLGRIIARPFLGKDAKSFKRTSNRHDYALSPSGETYLDILKSKGYDVISVGKIFDIFNGSGLTASNKIVSNHDGMEKTIGIAKGEFNGLCFVNLVDFDMEYGHRRNVIGYGKAIEEFDVQLGELIEVLREDDLLIITADHGNDPVHKGTDHTREKVPFVSYSKSFKNGGVLEEGTSFGDVGATVAENFGIKAEKLLGEGKLQKMK